MFVSIGMYINIYLGISLIKLYQTIYEYIQKYFHDLEIVYFRIADSYSIIIIWLNIDNLPTKHRLAQFIVF